MRERTQIMRERRSAIAGVLLPCAVMTIAAGSMLAAEPSTRPAAKWAFKTSSDLSRTFTSNDPIASIADRMDDVAIDLNRPKTDAAVQATEKEVVSNLDVLIAELTKQCKGGGGGSPNPTRPMGSSSLAKGPGGSGPMHDAKEGTRVWGQLPPRMRNQILQSQTEGFPPGYEAVLASYYAHLAQGQVPADTGDSAVIPATKPAKP
jgi:hypothetical protein